MNTPSLVPRPVTLAAATLIGIALVFMLALYGVLAYPGSARGEGASRLILLIAGLAAYAGAAAWIWRQPAGSIKNAAAQGAKFGAVLATFELVNMGIEHFVPIGPTGSAVRGVGMWALIFVVFGAAGSAEYRRSQSLLLAALASIWSALVSTVAMLIFGFALGVFFMPYMQRILAGAFSESGMSDPYAFVVRHTLDSACSHLLIAPVVAALFGTVGGYACSLLRSVRRSAAMVVGGLNIGLMIAGITALRLGSSLARPERPPFVMTGLIALGVGMACAHAVFTAIRRRPAV